MASALMRRSVLTAALAAIATVASPLATNAFAAPTPLGAPTNVAPTGTDQETRPTVTFTYAAAVDPAASSISVVDTSSSNAAVPCTKSVTNSGKTINCAVTVDLVDGHSYTATASVTNAADSTDKHTGATADTTSWTTDIPSEIPGKSSPAHGSNNASVTSVKTTFDESIDTNDFTVHVINAKGHDITNAGSASVSNSLNATAGAYQGTITWTSNQVGGLPASDYNVTFNVHGVTGTPAHYTDNPASFASVTVPFTVDKTLPADPPRNVTAPAHITQANQAAVPFSGYAPVGSNVAVAIYDEAYDSSDPFGADTEGTGTNDGLGTIVTADCTDDKSITSPNDVKLCPFTVTVDDSNSPDSGSPQFDQTGSPYTENLQWYAYTFTNAGQKPRNACPSATTSGCTTADPSIDKDASGPDTPSNATAKWSKTSPSTVTTQGATDSNTDGSLDHYLIVISDPEGHTVTDTAAKGAALSGYAMTTTVTPVDALNDGLLTVNVYGVDSLGNRSGADKASVTPATPPASNTLTKENVTTAPDADTSKDTLAVDGVTKTFSSLTAGSHVHTPTSVTVYFNEPIQLGVTDSSGTHQNSPVPLYTSQICLDDSTGPGSCLNSGVGTYSVTSDSMGLTWTAPANYQLPSDLYDVSAFAVSKDNCANKTNANSNGYTCDRSAQPGAALTHFTVDNQPPTVTFTSVPAVDANNVKATTISGTADGDTTQVVLSIKSSAGGSTRIAPIDTTPTSNGAGTINWTTTLDLSSLPDGTLSLSAIGHDGAGNTTAQDKAATATTSLQARPSAPQNFSVAAGSGNALLAWSAPATNGGHSLTGYALTIADTTAGTSTPVSIDPAALSYQANNLSNGHAYTFTLAAANDIGSGPSASKSATPKGNTAISVTGPAHGIITYGQSFGLSGYLTYTGVGIANEPVTVTTRYYNGANGPTYHGTTDQNGHWVVFGLKPAKNAVYTASFGGDGAYNGSSHSSGVLVRAAITIAKVTARSKSHSSPVTLSGKVGPNFRGYRVYFYEVHGAKLVKIGSAKLSSKSTWLWRHTFSKGKHLVIAKFFGHAGNQTNQTGRVKIVRT